MHSPMTAALAAEKVHDRLQQASLDRLAALARCCRPTVWARLGRLITGISVPTLPRPRPLGAPAACCP